MPNHLYKVASEIENQTIQIERIRAVYSEAENYFSSADAIKVLPFYGERILLLLHAADELLYPVIPKLQAAFKEIYAESNRQRGIVKEETQ